LFVSLEKIEGISKIEYWKEHSFSFNLQDQRREYPSNSSVLPLSNASATVFHVAV